MTATQEADRLDLVETLLVRRFGDRLPVETIRAEVRSGMTRYRDARVRTFIPVLLQREVTDRLRSLSS